MATAPEAALPELRAVEFYSGVGGWTMALEQARQVRDGIPAVRVVAAFDHSTVCNRVFAANHSTRDELCGKQPSESGPVPSQKPIERLSAADLDELAADLWLMSPPCQPYTRQRNTLEDQRKDVQDSRATSFLHLCTELQSMHKPPSVLVVENVVGFERSDSCARSRIPLCHPSRTSGQD